MSYAAGLFGGLNERRQQETAASRAEEDRLSSLETNLLMQLAQGDDPEIATMAGAGLLEIIAGNGKVQKAKGLRGFLGEVSRSSYLPGIKSVLDSRRATTPPTPGAPGGAALPPGSPVEPKAQGAAASLPPMPATSMAGLGLPPEMPSVARAGLGLPASTAAAGSPGGVAPPGPPGLGALGSPGSMPSPPENPAQKSARLFPSAAETAQQQAMSGLMAKYQAALSALEAAKGNPRAEDLVMGINGVPPAQLRPTSVNVDHIDPNTGVLTTSVGVINNNGAVMVDGIGRVQPVGDVRPINQRARQPIKSRRQRLNPDGTPSGVYDEVLIDPDTGEETVIPAGMPVNAPPAYSGTVELGDGRIGGIPRGGLPPGTTPPILGRENPPQPSTRTPAATTTTTAREAKAYYATLQARVKSQLATMRDPLGEPLKALPVDQLDALTKEVTRGRYATYESLQRGMQGLDVAASAAGGGPPAFGSPEGAAAIDAALAARRARPR